MAEAQPVAPGAWNPFLPEFRADPYPAYHWLQANDPVHWSEPLGLWVLSRYEDVVALLRDPRFSADRARAENFERLGRPEPPRSMLNADPPDHTRLRNLVNKAFAARAVEGLRPRVEQITAQLLDAAAARGEMEVIQDFAYPLPVTVIAELLGVPPSDRDRFREWTADIAATLDPIPDPIRQQRAWAAAEALREYFSEVVAHRRRHPREDLVTALVQAEEAGDQLSGDELLTMCNLLLIAGHETTVNLIGNGLLALLRHPAELARLRDEPALARTAVEELLRYDGPVQLTGRVATEEVEIGGRRIRPRQAVVALLGAANRDAAFFPEPDRLCLGRQPNPHLAFGAGIHFCLGAPLARLEAQVALPALIRRFPTLHLTAEPVWRPTIVLRGLAELRVAW